MNKVSIIGAGRVGEAAAQFMATMGITREIVLSDIKEGLPEGVALDIQESASIFDFDTDVTGSTDPEIITDSDVVVITAGIPRKPGMSRSDVLNTNINILDGIIEQTKRYCPDAMLILVSNPVDVLTWRAYEKSGLPRNKVFGQAGVLDSSRMAAFIALETQFSAKDIHAMVLGGHGDSMVPMVRFTTVSGICIDQFIDKETIEKIIARTRTGGAEVLNLRKTSSAYDAPGAAVAKMVEAIARDRHSIMPCVGILDGEYGYSNTAMGVPCVLGYNGVEKIIDLELTAAEKAMFDSSLKSVNEDIVKLKDI